MIQLLSDLDKVFHANVGREGAETLLVGHKMTIVHLIFNITPAGDLISITLAAKNQKELIPITAASSTRTSGIVPHPLHDTIQYLIPGDRYDAYIDQLSRLEENNKFFTAVTSYVSRGTVLQDIQSAGYIDTNMYPSNGLESILQKNKDGEFDTLKTMVSWTVDGCGYGPSEQRYWVSHYLQNDDAGGDVHPAAWGLAKLYSEPSNNNMLTTRGTLFGNTNASMCIDGKLLQTAYPTLSWLMGRQGKTFGDSIVIGFDTSGNPVDIMDDFEPQSASAGQESSIALGRKVWGGVGSNIGDIKILVLKKSCDRRCSIAHYDTYSSRQFENLLNKYAETCWDTIKGRRSAPGLKRIITGVLGTTSLNDGRIGALMDAHLNAVTKGRKYPYHIERLLIRNAINPLLARLVGTKDSWKYNDTITSAKAIARHNYKETDMSVDKNYAAGRALRILHNVEAKVLEDKNVKRQSNAERALPLAHTKPASAILQTHKKVVAYIGSLPVWAMHELATLLPIVGEADFTVDLRFVLGYYEQD